ncbi:MAG: AAA family ATPase [Acidiferrobacteraceae bacterium]
MLHRYAFSNFQSFRERAEVDLMLSRKVALANWMAEAPTGERVSKVMAVVGPNGSGKTALLKPMAFLSWFVSQSFQIQPDVGIPLTPHAATPNEPTEFECTMDFDGKLWRYVLRCTPQRVLHEALYQKHQRFAYVFVRDWDAVTNAYVVKQQDFGLPTQEASKVRQNVSLISWAAQFGVPLATRIAAPYAITNVNVLGRVPMGDQAVLSASKYFSVPRVSMSRTAVAMSFPRMWASTRRASGEACQARIKLTSRSALSFLLLTSLPYRSSASARVVSSASARETNTPRAISDSTVAAHAWACALVSNVLTCAGYPRRRTCACQTRFPRGPGL